MTYELSRAPHGEAQLPPTEIMPTAPREPQPNLPVHIPEHTLHALREANGLSFRPQFWTTIGRIPSDRPLVTRAKTKEDGTLGERRLAINVVNDVLLAAYAEPIEPKWRGVGRKSLYTLNILANYFAVDDEPQTAYMPTSDTMPGTPVVMVDDVVKFGRKIDICMGKGLIGNGVARLGRQLVENSYAPIIEILSSGNYTADEVDFTVKARPRQFVPEHVTNEVGIQINEVGIRSLERALVDESLLQKANIHPKMHYLLLRYIRTLTQRQEVSATSEYIRPPAHPAINDIQQPKEVPPSEFDGLQAIEPADDKTMGGLRVLTMVAMRSATKGVYYPLTSLYDHKKGEPLSPESVGLSRHRVARYLTNLLRSNEGSYEHTLIHPRSFATLIGADARHGAPEDLPHADHKRGGWTDEPVLTLNAVRKFAVNFGKDLAVDAVQHLINDMVDGYLAQHTPHARLRADYRYQKEYNEDGTFFTVKEPAFTPGGIRTNVQGITVNAALKRIGEFRTSQSGPDERAVVTGIILGKYLKALRLQGDATV